jgi:putative ABC transport system permease protein
MRTILQDATHGVRQLRAHRSFAVVAVLTLGVGIGVSTALFSVIDAALLRPLPYAHSEELVTLGVEEVRAGGRTARYAPSIADIRAWRDLGDVVAHVSSGRVRGFTPLIVDTGTAERLIVASASEDFFETYGVSPIRGRAIQVEDTREGAPAVALLGHAFWQSHFSGDPGVLGRTLRVQDEPVSIIGVLPPGFFGDTAVWQAARWPASRLDQRGSGTPVIARLRPGVTPDQAAIRLTAVTRPSSISETGAAAPRVLVNSMYEDETSGYGSTIRTLAWAVGLVVVIACVNVAGLLLARGATRYVELAVRASMGAGRGRLVRQLLVESLMLACAGAVVGIGLAYASLDSLVALIPLSLPYNSPATINPTVLAFALALTLMTAVLFGLVPALKLSRAVDVHAALGGGTRGAITPLTRRAGQWLIGIEVALALVLMSGSGLMVRSFSKLTAVDLGFDLSNVLTVEVEPVAQEPAVRQQFYPALQDALRAMPEVLAVGGVDQLALTGGGSYSFPKADTGVGVEGPQRTVLPGFLEALGVHPTAGRLLESGDLAAGEAAIISATGAAQYFPDGAVGHTLVTSGPAPRHFRIVGIVPDLKHGGPQGRLQPQMYVLPDPGPQTTRASALAIVMRLRQGTSIGPQRLKEVAESIGPRVVMGRIRPIADVLGEFVARPRHRMALLVLLGSLGLALTLVGIASMTAYAVARRTREIGVRMALGARPIDVVRGTVRDAAWPVALGVLAGLAGTYYATRVIASFLYETPPHDPATLTIVALLLVAAGSLAAWLPARRAATIDPVAALRAE